MSTATVFPTQLPLASPASLVSKPKNASSLIARVMQQPDDLVLVLEYADKKGSLTRRVVSPIRFLAPDRFLALCLSRQEPRQFYIDRCRNIRVDLAIQYVMPVELQEIESASSLSHGS